jgi:hypothetical protein
MMRIPFRRIPRRRLAEALLVAAFLLAALAASLRFFAVGSAGSAGASAVGLTPAPGGGQPERSAADSRAGSGSRGSGSNGQPAAGATGHPRASTHVTPPPPVNVAGAAALPSADVHAGNDTPVDAVDGFYLALLSGSPARACAYVTSPCPSFGSRAITGQVTVLDAVANGREALVEVTGSICVGPSCVPLVDRVLMPTGPANFGASWTSLTSGVYGWAASPLPCVQDAATRQWRVKLA